MSNGRYDINYVSSLAEEEKLLEQMAAGNKHAFDTLYKYFQPKILRYIFPFTFNSGIDPEEIVQDIFVKMWTKREAFAGIKSLEHYLYRMARNRLIDFKRSSSAHHLHNEQYTGSKPLMGNTTSYEVEYREFHQIAVKAIHRLPERRRKIFDLCIERDMSLSEIASVMQLSVSVVKKQLYLATSYVRKCIKEKPLSVIFLVLIIQLFGTYKLGFHFCI